ncbi:MAG: chorismate synthase, partial [Elusimicrobiota bacterium]|nr:chorismate synthase [Elusimicrobiota bacterium]
MLRLITAGESHGKGIISILEGIPAGLSIKIKDIDLELIRRQSGYGRGARMKIEKDGAEILSGIRQGRTLGSPITIFIKNRDWENNKNLMSEFPADKINAPLQKPRPGHADLAGYMKYGVSDFRDILERASARETAGRAAAGAICKIFLKVFGINVYSFVSQIGGICADFEKLPLNKILIKAAKSPLSCPDEEASKKMIALIEETAQKGDTLGGKFIVKITGVPAGLGSHTQWDLKLDGRLAQSLMSIQAVKSVEFGLGSNLAGVLGSNASDEIFYKKEKGFYRKTNRAGGIEGGMSNGEVI